MTRALAKILAPMDPREFRDTYYEQRPIQIRGSAEKFASLFTWESLNRVLGGLPVPCSAIDLTLQGKMLAPNSPDQMLDFIDRGATLIVGNIQRYDPKLAEFTAELVHEIGEPVRINLYLSQPGKQGYNRHYDTHDVFVLQISGTKGWKLYDSTTALPLWIQKTHDTDAPQVCRSDITLNPGDVLYIPRGYWHEATAQAEPSLHLTLGVYSRTGIDFIQWLADELRQDVQWRAAAPLTLAHESPADGRIPPTIETFFSNLCISLARKLEDPELISNYRRFCIAEQRSPAYNKLPLRIIRRKIVIDSAETLYRAPYQTALLNLTPENVLEVTVWGKVLTFPLSARPLVEFIFDRTTFTGSSAHMASEGLSWDDVSKVLAVLAGEDIIGIASNSPEA